MEKLCATFSPFTKIKMVWNIVRYLKFLSEALTALALLRGTLEITMVNKFCVSLIQLGAAMSSSKFCASREAAEKSIAEVINWNTSQVAWNFSIRELEGALSTICKCTTPGHDQITYEALSNLGPDTKGNLLVILNDVWTEETLPDSWRLAKVVPLFKYGKTPAALESFRPVSLTSCVGKLMEKRVHLRLQWWFESNCVLPAEMTIFHPLRCTIGLYSWPFYDHRTRTQIWELNHCSFIFRYSSRFWYRKPHTCSEGTHSIGGASSHLTLDQKLVANSKTNHSYEWRRQHNTWAKVPGLGR